MCALDGADELVQLDLDRRAVAILRVLDDEDHEERHDRRGGVDDELPRVAEPEHGPADHPEEDDENGSGERDRVTRKTGHAL